ncbi:RluA family pseudouridine synthase [Fodinisporobacter ferrooxydans]|uniref:Pseudouridine synthase n=1 Tax=Fodinisporobacter ferrooxydans TaxID=2901836 RepID=A0ABY4CI43_9BACL|nr:RluA family pseudouridine synthase [Alicyclobacillaceae bacterium MYW30-H2]
MVTYTITKHEAGKKLHRFVRTALPGLPLSGVHKLIRVGRVKVNGRKGKTDTLLEDGDTIIFYMSQDEFDSLKKQTKKFSGISTEIDIIYEDEHLLLVNKPIGMLTHPDQQEHKHTLINQVLAYLHEQEQLDQRLFTPSTVNRLDRNTSGIVIIGKDAATIRELNEEIKHRKLGKWYLTVVHGQVRSDGEITADLVREEASNRTRIAKPNRSSNSNKDIKSAHTVYKVLDSNPKYSLLEIELISGRTHQIRAHMQSIGHPLAGDVKYGGKIVHGLHHQMLHAYRVQLADGREFQAPLPAEFASFLKAAHVKPL